MLCFHSQPAINSILSSTLSLSPTVSWESNNLSADCVISESQASHN
uniref:Uncharacterized protein n=1 Tax=Tetranychus urticae TaxID=32264 RepID=T1JQZ1_TETUR